MKRFMTASAVLAVCIPASAQALSHSQITAYERAYWSVQHKMGKRAAGCKLIGRITCHGQITDARIMRSTGVLQRMLTPPPIPAPAPVAYGPAQIWTPPPAPVYAAPASAAPVSSGGASGVPACASESGTNYSTGPANTNGSSGATGRYQITPSTAANYGCSLATPAGQDACAQVIYQNQGAGAWVGCGG